MTASVSRRMIHRFANYLQAAWAFRAEGASYISSQKLGKRVGVLGSRVREDLRSVEIYAEKKGYDAGELMRQLSALLGIDCGLNVAMLGDKGMGKAVSDSRLLEQLGMNVVLQYPVPGAGETAEGLRDALNHAHAELVILNDDSFSTQKLLPLLEQTGAQAVWNLTGSELYQEEESSLCIENTQLSDSLLSLACKIMQREQEKQEGKRP